MNYLDDEKFGAFRKEKLAKQAESCAIALKALGEAVSKAAEAMRSASLVSSHHLRTANELSSRNFTHQSHLLKREMILNWNISSDSDHEEAKPKTGVPITKTPYDAW